MRREKLTIEKIPALLFGEPSERVFLYIHGQGGSKEEAAGFAAIAEARSWQVLSIDLPGHGERKREKETFYPWNAVPELQTVMAYAKKSWKHVSLFANSIGAYFGMLSFDGKELENCLFLSPILDMERLISNMMLGAGVTEDRLQRELIVANPYGAPLSWEYLQYAKSHPISSWPVPTGILYGGKDHLTERDVLDQFVQKFGCDLTVMELGEHWFHTDGQLDCLYRWAELQLLRPERRSANSIFGLYVIDTIS